MNKTRWSGLITSVQPRIHLTRSFDERHHSYPGYSLRIEGFIGDEEREFSVGIGKAATVLRHLPGKVRLLTWRPIAIVGIAAWQRVPTTLNAEIAFGVAGCR